MSLLNANHRPRFQFQIRLVSALAIIAALVAGAASVASGWTTENSRSGESTVKPTIVLVHGAFADASGWNQVSESLQERGYTVIAPANPLRNLASDSAYISSILSTIEGPIVLVGHSYGGAVITNAATGHANVKALVYIAAFAPDAGERVGALAAMNPGSGLIPQNLVIRPYPGGVDGYINPHVFHRVFAADVSDETAAVMGASQRPGDLGTLMEPSGTPAWKTIRSWYMVASNDNAIPAATERFMAKRMRATTVEVESSHVAMISHPREATDLILDAVEATS
jgi:pimeloyl-ACP methyl ester carboxylesterase